MSGTPIEPPKIDRSQRLITAVWIMAVVFWMAVIMLFLGTSQPPLLGDGQFQAVRQNALIGHLVLFGVLGYLASMAALAPRQSKKLYTALVVAVLLGSVWAVFTEWFQTLVPGRDGSVVDVIVDIAGVTLGFLTAWYTRYLILRFGYKRRRDIRRPK